MATIRTIIRCELNRVKSYAGCIVPCKGSILKHVKNIEYLLNNFSDIGEEVHNDEIDYILNHKPIRMKKTVIDKLKRNFKSREEILACTIDELKPYISILAKEMGLESFDSRVWDKFFDIIKQIHFSI